MSKKSIVLVIDDEETMLDSCYQIFAKEGYQTETAKDGYTGLEKLKEAKPDLVLVDLRMPGKSGMEVLEELREIDPNCVAVVITGYATIESAVEAMKRGAYDFLPKPFTPDELRIIAKRGLERRKLGLEAESLRKEKEKLRENFITMVTHELRAPLTAVQQYFETILGGFAGEVTAKQEKMLKRASERVDGLLTLIKDWLNISRIHTGEAVEKLGPLVLAPMIAKVVDFLQPLAEKSKVALHLESPADLPMVRGDKETLEVVFTNLISNGIKYNVERGKVEVRLREEGDSIAAEVADTGIGIPERDLPFIFDEFFRVRSGETQCVVGSGLGLSIAKKIVEAHSGLIQATSELGKGSRFTVLLPK